MRTSAAQKQRLRGVILKLVQQQHEKQAHRHDDYSLLAVLDKLNFDVHLDLVRELVQDLIERECLAASQAKNLRSGETLISKIEIRPRGRDILEGSDKDPAIFVEPE